MALGKISISDFEHFLVSKSLIKEKYIPYYTHWARKFLVFINDIEPANQDICKEKYLNYLNSQTSISDWQVRQADDAVRLLIYNFLGGNLAEHHPIVLQSTKKQLSLPGILRETQKAQYHELSQEFVWAENY